MREGGIARTEDVETAPAERRNSATARQPVVDRLLSLQSAGGNQMVLRMLVPGATAAPGIRVSDPDSPLEQQAGLIAGSESGSRSGPATAAPVAGASPVAAGSGSPLDPAVRLGMERTLEADLSEVRVHDDPASHDFAHRAGAQAATVGSHVYFGRDRFAPETSAGEQLLRHELVHTLQSDTGAVPHRTPENEGRQAEIERLLSSVVITDEYRAQLTAERQTLLSAGDQPTPVQAIDVVSLTPAEYEALTGLRADELPEGELPGLTPAALSPIASGVPATIGNASLFTSQTNWYYRVLSPTDPTASQLLGGAGLTPRAPDPGFSFQPAGSPAEMTFRHLRPGGNVPQVGTDRISTAQDLAAFDGILAGRGTGEMVRVDVDTARRLGAEFLEKGDIMAHLDAIGRDLEQQLEAARAAGRGKNFIAKLEGRLGALERAREYARTFGEGQGVDSIPGRAVGEVEGATLTEAVAGERALLGNIKVFRYGGRVLLVVGLGMSIARVATAPEGQRGRVAAQETGGWAFSLAGGAAGAKGGAALGAALGWETGPGAVVAVILGGLIGGAIGFFGGEVVGDAAYDMLNPFSSERIDEAARRDFERFKQLNPDATPADYDRLQQQQDDFDTWGLP